MVISQSLGFIIAGAIIIASIIGGLGLIKTHKSHKNSGVKSSASTMTADDEIVYTALTVRNKKVEPPSPVQVAAKNILQITKKNHTLQCQHKKIPYNLTRTLRLRYRRVYRNGISGAGEIAHDIVREAEQILGRKFCQSQIAPAITAWPKL